MPSWTLERELKKLTRQTTLGSALVFLELLTNDIEPFSIESDDEWRRGGAETYLYCFSVHRQFSIQHVIIKAAVPFSLARSLDEVMASWIERRHLLEIEGIKTPRVFFAGSGLIVEEFVKYSVAETIRGPVADTHLIDQVVFYAGVLSKLGFAPTDAFTDLRTNGTIVYAIDFGQDLGPPNVTDVMDDSMYNRVVQWLNQHLDQDHAVDQERSRLIFNLAKQAESPGLLC